MTMLTSVQDSRGEKERSEDPGSNKWRYNMEDDLRRMGTEIGGRGCS